MQSSERSKLGSIALLVVSGLGLAVSLFAALLLLLAGVVGVFGQAVPLNELVAVFALAWIALLVGALALPAVVLSAGRLLGHDWDLPARVRSLTSGFRMASLSIFLWPLALAAGTYVAGMSQVAWLLLPPLHLLAVSLPIWWLVEVARRGLPAGSLQRGWGILSTSLFVTTPSVIILELLGLVLLALGAVIAVSMVPEWLNEVEQLAERLALLQNDPQAIAEIFQAYLENPLAVFAILGLLAVVVPMLEEFFKPLAVWFLLGRRITRAEGFVAGAICGGAFALLESLMTLSSTPENEGWASLVIVRAGTGLLHISTTSLMGWALAGAWRERQYARLLVSFLLAVAMHGIWNALSIIFSLGLMLQSPPPEIAWMARLAPAAPLALLILVAGLFTFLWASNRRLRNESLKLVSETMQAA